MFFTAIISLAPGSVKGLCVASCGLRGYLIIILQQNQHTLHEICFLEFS